MALDPLPEPDVTPPDHVPDDLVAMYGREAEQSVRYSRSRRYRVTKEVRRKASTTMHDIELWSVAGMVFFWGVAAVTLIGALVYAVMLWPTAGIALAGTVALLIAVSLTVGMKQARRQRQAVTEESTSFNF
jgi:hypothetical protein